MPNVYKNGEAVPVNIKVKIWIDYLFTFSFHRLRHVKINHDIQNCLHLRNSFRCFMFTKACIYDCFSNQVRYALEQIKFHVLKYKQFNSYILIKDQLRLYSAEKRNDYSHKIRLEIQNIN